VRAHARARRSRLPRPRGQIVAFLAVPLIILTAVALGTVLVSERIARSNALAEVQRSAERLSRFVVTPLVEDALAGAPGRWEELEQDVANRLRDGSLDTVVVWTSDRSVLWSSDKRLVGQRATSHPQLQRALDGQVVSDVDEQPEAAPPSETVAPRLEVYVPATIRGEKSVVEVYYRFEGVERLARLLRGEIIPLAVGALVVLQLVQVPIAMSWTSRLRRQEAERAELMQRTITASDAERRTIAADVHDGPVQDLAGVGYALTSLRASLPPERLPTMDRVIGAVRHAVQSLRRLMIDIYPPDLSGPGLPAAIADLLPPLRDLGLAAELETEPVPDMSPAAAAVLYRTAKEALSNVVHHSGARRVWVTLTQVGDDAVRLEISDDGIGLAHTGPDITPDGHLGLRLLRGRVTGVGGDVELGNRYGGGAVVVITVPLHHTQ